MTLLGPLKERLRPPQWMPVALSHTQSLVRLRLVTNAQRLASAAARADTPALDGRIANAKPVTAAAFS